MQRLGKKEGGEEGKSTMGGLRNQMQDWKEGSDSGCQGLGGFIFAPFKWSSMRSFVAR